MRPVKTWRHTTLAYGILWSQSLAAPISRLSVWCRGSELSTSCGVGQWNDSDWTARGSFVQSQNETGWASLFVETASGASESTAAFAAGFAEGFLTAELISDLWKTLVASGAMPSEGAQHFVNAQVAFVQAKVGEAAASADHGDTRYWRHVGLAYEQVSGIASGYNSAARILALAPLDASQIMWMNLQGESGDIEMAVNASSRPDFGGMSSVELTEHVRKTTHCSALIRATPELDDIFVAHVTWCPYTWMLRIVKAYDLRFASSEAERVLMSGYPGLLSSTDDFYTTSQKLVITETTNGIFNSSLYDLIVPETVPYWARNLVANRLATNAREWHEVFYRWNSGTCNNQWIVVDFKGFVPGQPLPPWTLAVSEQLPGTFSHPAEDMTVALQFGHWPSYNVPYFRDVHDASGYPEQVYLHGAEQGFQLAPRAPIFRRDAERVNSLEDMQHFARLNAYGSGDPLARTPWHAIASRGDLDPSGATASGAIDAKVVGRELVEAMSMYAQSGPTSQGQDPFSFTGEWSGVPHNGMAERFDFDWEIFTFRALQVQGAGEEGLTETQKEAVAVPFQSE